MKNTLKAMAMILCIATVGLTTGCSDDDNDASIVGSWKAISETTIISEYADFRDSETDIDNDPGYIYKFFEDGTGQWIEEDFEPDPFTYTLHDNTLILIDAKGDKEEFEVKELSSKKLILYEEIHEEVEHYKRTTHFNRM